MSEDQPQAPYGSPTPQPVAPQPPTSQQPAYQPSGEQPTQPLPPTQPTSQFAPQFQTAPPVQSPVQPAQPARSVYPREGRWNTCSILGIIFAFVFAIVGLILSIVGLVQTNRTHEKGRGLAIAGIIVSVIMMVIGGVGAYNLMNAVQQQEQLAAAPTTSFSEQAPSADGSDSASPSASAGASDDANLGADADQGLSELEQDDSSLTSVYGSMSELVADPDFNSEMKSTIGESFEGTGAEVDMRAEGDALVFDIHLPAKYDAAAAEIKQQFSSNAEEQFQPMADSLVGLVKTEGPGPQVRMYLHTDSQTIFDQTFTGKQ